MWQHNRGSLMYKISFSSATKMKIASFRKKWNFFSLKAHHLSSYHIFMLLFNCLIRRIGYHPLRYEGFWLLAAENHQKRRLCEYSFIPIFPSIFSTLQNQKNENREMPSSTGYCIFCNYLVSERKLSNFIK